MTILQSRKPRKELNRVVFILSPFSNLGESLSLLCILPAFGSLDLWGGDTSLANVTSALGSGTQHEQWQIMVEADEA